jgi:hypothetical protein
MKIDVPKEITDGGTTRASIRGATEKPRLVPRVIDDRRGSEDKQRRCGDLDEVYLNLH